MIDEELLFQESRKKGITVEPETIATDLKKIKQKFANDADFKKALGESGLTEAELQSSLERGYVINKLIDNQIMAPIVIPDQEIRTFYDTHPKSFKKSEQVRASHILIKVDSQAERSVKDEKKAKLQEVQKRLKDGEDFAVLAKEFSECPSNIKGGDLGYFERGKMVKPFEDVAFKLKTGEVSDIVETPFGYHLIKVVDKKPASVVGYEDVKDKIGQYLKKEKTGKELKGYIEELRKKAVIEKVSAS
jgi:peptidyl-prolyl cis-trans isomerase C